MSDARRNTGENSLPMTVERLGWSGFLAAQIEADDSGLVPMGVANVHRSGSSAITENGPVDLTLPALANTGVFAIGDWVMADPQTLTLPLSLIQL